MKKNHISKLKSENKLATKDGGFFVQVIDSVEYLSFQCINCWSYNSLFSYYADKNNNIKQDVICTACSEVHKNMKLDK